MDSWQVNPYDSHFQASAWHHSLSFPERKNKHLHSSWHNKRLDKCKYSTDFCYFCVKNGGKKRQKNIHFKHKIYLVRFLAIRVGLPHQHAKAPHITFRWKFEVINTLRCIPLYGPLPMTFGLRRKKRKIQEKNFKKSAFFCMRTSVFGLILFKLNWTTY